MLLNRDISLVLSKWLHGEFEEALGYPRIVERTVPGSGRLTALAQILARENPPDVPPMGTVRDPDDRNVLGAAVALGADVIVSGDKDLLILDSFEGIPILSPRQFVDFIDELATSAP